MGIDGTELPDAEFAHHLQHTLEEEKLVSGKRARVTLISDSNNEIEEVIRAMGSSVIVLIVFSEAALQSMLLLFIFLNYWLKMIIFNCLLLLAFSGDYHGFRQNNYLLFLQFALHLHHARGVRVISSHSSFLFFSSIYYIIYQIIIRIAFGSTWWEWGRGNAFIKFQGWCVSFKDVPHYSECIFLLLLLFLSFLFFSQFPISLHFPIICTSLLLFFSSLLLSSPLLFYYVTLFLFDCIQGSKRASQKQWRKYLLFKLK